MGHILYLPMQYVILTKKESSIYIVYNEVTKLIIAALIPNMLHKNIVSVISQYRGEGYEQTEFDRYTQEKYKELKETYG